AEGEVVSTGWAINMSRSGIRASLEERSLAGVDYSVTVGGDGTTQLTRRARVVWLQEEHDGFVAGLEFASQSGLHKAASSDDGKDDGDDDVLTPPKKDDGEKT
ncbi:MAG: PilZ domain-containing protein, partial [Polyangiaceae bacterium]